ncbi:MAG: hypothetical protein E6I57_13150 [Chloroflexi bacterium]|nr:MAG: hypothetical protein E6J38_09150 [Chloroflexota bacterium]TMC29669.1 MAG: hypothetical protein E6J27_04975 [Chloroflexota bacterium]TMC32898.1 MAG: hypothetical protein E6J24_12270 [Chloroflexota bacterium]TMC59067.1 MAG: hypothetical protein E6J19_00765 [Chloroflexota bacterium]TME36783.1 MAG: hypothetical protein E6I57_13150 [Chloroflexota bacterium]
MLRPVREWISHHRYESATDARQKRDLRLDLLRGFCVFVMIVDHVGGEASWLYWFTGGNRLVVSAAEGFVLLSGITMGMVHHVTIRTQGFRAMFGKVFGRAWLLYSVTVMLTIAFAAISSALGDPYADTLTPAKSRADFAFSVITFHRTYSLTDVLVLYTLLVIMSGPLLWLIARGHSGPVLAASIATWMLFQVWPERIPRAWEITDGGFPLSAWQLIFVIGLLVGFHRARIATVLRPVSLIGWAVLFAVVIVLVRLIVKYWLAPDVDAIDIQELLFDKNDARIGRVLALLAATSFAYAGVTLLWTLIRRATGWLLLPMGRNALFAYGVQLFVVAFFGSDLMAPVRLDRENALFQATAVGMVWLACFLQPRAMRRYRAWQSRASTVAAAHGA